MKISSVVFALVSFVCGLSLSCGRVSLSSDIEKYSFAIGHQIGENMKRQELEIDLNAFKAGVAEGIKGVDEKMSPKDRVQALKVMTEMINKKATDKKAEDGGEK